MSRAPSLTPATNPTIRTHTVPAADDLPARHYRSETWRIGTRTNIEVSAHDEGDEPRVLCDGGPDVVKAALQFETRMSTRRVSYALRALVP